MSVTSGLPAGMLDWVAEVAGGPVVRAERHVARREAWVVDAERPDGSLLEGFLRLERDPKPGNMWSLEKETAIVTALGPTAVPVAMVHGWNADLTCALFQRVAGTGEIAAAAAGDRRSIMEQFVDAIAAMHRLDLDELALPQLPGLRRPATARESALGEVEAIVQTWTGFLASYTDPLITYGLDWLRRFAPEEGQPNLFGTRRYRAGQLRLRRQ